jgi:hypothetical protein
MGFTYLGTLATNRDRVRFHVGDVTEDGGPRPADANFSDAEIDQVITDEGTWQRAVASCFERLAAEWTRYPTFRADGLALNRTDIAKGYRADAELWRKRYGAAMPIRVAGQITKDAYSDDVASDDVDTSSEYESDFEYVVPD